MMQRKSMCRDLDQLKAAKTARMLSVGQQERLLKQLGSNLRTLDETARPLHVSRAVAVASIAR